MSIIYKSDLEKKVVEHLIERQAQFSEDRLSASGMLSFSIPGESKKNGRLTIKGDSISIFHFGSPNGLNLQSPFTSEKKIINNREITSHKITANDVLNLANSNSPLQKISKERVSERSTYDQPSFINAVMHNLESAGWKYEREIGGLQYWNDGAGSSAANRVKINEGIASAWSFRNDVDLPRPWQQGRDTKYGNKSLFITARDLGVESNSKAIPAPAISRSLERESLNKGTVDLVRKSWREGDYAPVNHPQLNKSSAHLNSTLLKVFPDNPETKQKHLAGDLIAPLFRADGKGGIELSGAQRLMSKPFNGNDKMLLTGTQAAGSFMPIPPFTMMTDRPSLDAWIQQLGQQAKDKPLVIIEGVASGIAIHQSGAGNALVAISSGNLPTVAKWVKESGLDKHFPAGVVIAADLDINRDSNGRLKSNGIPKALEAAEILNAKVALAPAGNPNGFDARDLLGQGGGEAVRKYISEAVSHAQIKERSDLSPPQQETQIKSVNQEITR